MSSLIVLSNRIHLLIFLKIMKHSVNVGLQLFALVSLQYKNTWIAITLYSLKYVFVFARMPAFLYFIVPIDYAAPQLSLVLRFGQDSTRPTGHPEFDFRQRQGIFPVASVSRPALRPTQLPIQWRPGRDADHSLHLVPRSRMSRSYISSPPWRLHGGSGTGLFFLLLLTYKFTQRY
jgi:hypothetical protein